MAEKVKKGNTSSVQKLEEKPSQIEAQATMAHTLWSRISTRQIIAIAAIPIILFIILAAVPYTRYALAGMILQQDFSIQVIDSETQRPVSNASVVLSGRQQETDGNGKVRIHAKVGPVVVTVSKSYYQSTSKNMVVPIFGRVNTLSIRIKATGRQIPIVITNKIDGKPVANITIRAAKTTATTSSDGKATLALPANSPIQNATLSGEGFNEEQTTIKVTADGIVNNLTITPAGKVYFLSNLSGTLDVVKTDLDGGNRQTVLVGTGRENQPSTLLFASNDWRYLALYSRRDGGDYAKLFLIDTATGSMDIIDDTKANFTVGGWYGGRYLVYLADHPDIADWQPKRQTLISYDAESKTSTTLDSTLGIGDNEDKYLHETMSTPYEVNGEVVIAKSLTMGGFGLLANMHTSTATVVGMAPDGTKKHIIKSFGPGEAVDISEVSIDLSMPKPNDLFIQFSPQYQSGQTEYWEYMDGKVKQITAAETTNNGYAAYLESPSGQKTLWAEQQDGKNSVYIGDASGNNGKQVLLGSDYQVYGWFTENYILLSKSGSELYIMPASGLNANQSPTKIANYYRPEFISQGYGSNYGGF